MSGCSKEDKSYQRKNVWPPPEHRMRFQTTSSCIEPAFYYKHADAYSINKWAK